jgi:mRNA-degrading endonuclease RelE of RelBE toxin-antitoxin system
MFAIRFTSKSKKQYLALEAKMLDRYTLFFRTIQDNPFVGKLFANTYHAHVKYHWVAVWTVDDEAHTITVSYVGSREGAPY